MKWRLCRHEANLQKQIYEAKRSQYAARHASSAQRLHVRSTLHVPKERFIEKNGRFSIKTYRFFWVQGPDLNRRPPGYEPDELPNCSTLRYRKYQNQNTIIVYHNKHKMSRPTEEKFKNFSRYFPTFYKNGGKTHLLPTQRRAVLPRKNSFSAVITKRKPRLRYYI